jgi:hypothetical protein
MSQTTLDLNSRLKMAQPPKPGEHRKVVVAEVKEQSANELFGERAKEPAKRLYVLYARIEDGKEPQRIGFFNVPFDGATVSEKSNLAKFQQRYGAFPKAGLPVEIVANLKGFWRVSVD